MPIARTIAAGVVVALALFAAGCDSKVSKANYDKVTVGMTLSEVERILGSGEEDTSSGGVNITGGGVASGSGKPTDRVFVWKTSNGGQIVVTIGPDSKVAQKRESGL